MSSKFIADWFPWVFTAQERSLIQKQNSQFASNITSKITTDYSNPSSSSTSSNSRHHHSNNKTEISSSSSSPSLKRRPQLNYLINWNLFTSTSDPKLLKDTFVQSHLDEETKSWIVSKSEPSTMRQMISDVFAQFFGRTSANGLCFRGEMFVFSRYQMKRLLEKRLNKGNNNDANNNTKNSTASGCSQSVLSRYNRNLVTELGENDNNNNESEELIALKNDESFKNHFKRLLFSTTTKNSSTTSNNILDIGAGDGGVTKHVFAPFFDNIFTTEDNPVMRLRLKNSFGWNNCFSSSQTSDVLLCTTTTDDGNKQRNVFNTVALLNVLDRCDKPLTLLKEIREHLIISQKEQKENSSQPPPPILVLAVVLPWCPFVENGSKQEQPSETLPMHGGGFCREGASFEASLEKLVANVLVPSGFKICSWTRVPYLCEGDLKNEYYCLDDALFVLEAV